VASYDWEMGPPMAGSNQSDKNWESLGRVSFTDNNR
jgi:hypothetical protein